MKVIAVIPAFNERKKVGKVINEIAKYVDKIVVIDDGSSDGTYLAVKNRKAVVLRHPINLGQGAALQTGFEYAKKTKYDIVVTYDADGQFKASEIKNIIAPIVEGGAEVTLGSRFLGKAIDIPLSRLVVLKLGIFFTYIFSGIQLTDTHNGLRAFSQKALTKISIKHNRWAHPSDIIFQISKNKLRVTEVPVTVVYTAYSREKGQSNFEALKIPFELIMRELIAK